MAQYARPQAPEVFRSTEETSAFNEFLRQSGHRLQKLSETVLQQASENERLLEKLAQAERRDQFYEVAEAFVAKGVLTDRQVRAKVSEWMAGDKTPAHYRTMLDGYVNPNFLASENAGEGVDARSSGGHSEKRSSAAAAAEADLDRHWRALREVQGRSY